MKQATVPLGVAIDRVSPAVVSGYIALRKLRPGERPTQVEVANGPSGALILDFDAEGRLLGIGTLMADRVFPAELIATVEGTWPANR